MSNRIGENMRKMKSNRSKYEKNTQIYRWKK